MSWEANISEEKGHVHKPTCYNLSRIQQGKKKEKCGQRDRRSQGRDDLQEWYDGIVEELELLS